MVEIARLYLNDRLLEEIDYLPERMMPAGRKPNSCCIHMDWALLKYRIMALMGLRAEDCQETVSLSEYAKQAIDRQKVQGPVLSVIHSGCSGCTPAKYFVTNACQNCLAHPCQFSCKKDAISFPFDQAYIDPSKCVNCGMCMNACPYHAIVKIPVPCEEVCPVGAISKDEDNKIIIDFDACIFCGKCTRGCPFGAIKERSQIIDVLKRIKNKDKVIACVAPAVVGQYPATLGQIVSAFKQLGFASVFEVAQGADVTSQVESAEFVERVVEGPDALMGTSCCPAYVEAVNKHLPEFKPFVSHARTPMSYTAEDVKKKHPDCVTVFIGPCFAKKNEAFSDEFVDYVLTFEEAGSMLVAADIEVGTLEESEPENSLPGREGRSFPVSGGVAQAVKDYAGPDIDVKPVLVDGLTKKSLSTLKVYAKGHCPGNLVEVMACQGGCIAGPGVVSNPKFSTRSLKQLLDQTPPKSGK